MACQLPKEVMQIRDFFDIEKYRVNIEIIKLTFSTLCYVELSIKQCIEKAISYLVSYYDMEHDKKYLICSVLHMQAYLEMGYDYDDDTELFNSVLKELGTDRQVMFPRKFYQSHQIKLNKSQVRSMIGKWNAANSMPIAQVVDDIIDKVKNHKEGIYYYKNTGSKKELFDGKVNGDVYELVIKKNDCYFHDVRKKKYFTFIQ